MSNFIIFKFYYDTWGAFHSPMKNRFELPKVPLAKETAFSRIPGREDSLFVVYIEIPRKFLSGNSFPFRLYNSLFGNPTISVFFLSIFRNFPTFWLNVKHPKFSVLFCRYSKMVAVHNGLRSSTPGHNAAHAHQRATLTGSELI